MGRNSMMELRCRKHPTHKQSKGVCPSCLRERLVQLPTSSSSSSSTTHHYSNTSSWSSSSSLSTYSSDSDNSSVNSGSPLQKFMAKTMSFSYALTREGNKIKPLMRKSRSLIAFVVEGKDEDNNTNDKKTNKKKKKESFWSLLMGRKSKEEEDGGVLKLHCKVVRRRLSANNKWV